MAVTDIVFPDGDGQKIDVGIAIDAPAGVVDFVVTYKQMTDLPNGVPGSLSAAIDFVAEKTFDGIVPLGTLNPPSDILDNAGDSIEGEITAIVPVGGGPTSFAY